MDEQIAALHDNPAIKKPTMLETGRVYSRIDSSKKAITPTMTKALTAEFPPEAYKKVTQRGGYMTLQAGYITERLNEVFGVGRWKLEHETNSYPETKTNAEGATMVTMHVVTKGHFESLDYDTDTTTQYGSSKLDNPIGDSFKKSVTDCLSKVASQLGVGNSLFKGLIEENGKSKAENKADKKEKEKKAKDVISPEDLKRIGDIIKKEGGATKELAKNILLEKFGIPHTTDVKKMTLAQGKQLVAKMLNPANNGK